MVEGDRIEIRRDELYAPGMEEALEERRALLRRIEPDLEPVSPLRGVLLSSLFYLPMAGLAGALLAWILLEPHFEDFSTIGGTIVLRNNQPFDAQLPGAFRLTVGAKEVTVVPKETKLEAGADGQPAFGGFDELVQGKTIEAVGTLVGGQQIIAFAVRPATEQHAARTGQVIEPEFKLAGFLLFPITAVLITLSLAMAEGMASRNWVRCLERAALGGLLTTVFSLLAYIPAGISLSIGGVIVALSLEGKVLFTAHTMPPVSFVVFAACRSMAWAAIGAGLGLGMNLVRSTRAQLRNSVIGGTLGGALGGIFFDPIDRFLGSSSAFTTGDISRLVGLSAVGLCVGLFVALVDFLAREAWIRVRTGPLAGKSFVLYRTPTILGSSPRADIYIFKDSGIDPSHSAIHRVGMAYEIEDLSKVSGTVVGGQPVRRRRLVSGDQIVLGSTVLEFEEREKRSDDS